MSTLSVFHSLPSQKKALLSYLCVIDPSDSNFMTFDLDNGDPCLPLSVAFQILVNIKNIIIHLCLFYEKEFTCVMLTHVSKHLDLLDSVPSSITLRAYDGMPSKPHGHTRMSPLN